MLHDRAPTSNRVLASRGWLLWAALATAFASACDNPDRCKEKPDCAKLGKCTATEQGLCVVGSSADCKASELCSAKGKCSAKDGECLAASDADCQGSAECKQAQSCSAYRGSCEDPSKTVHAECTKSCTAEGLCVMQAGKCAALSRRHCAGTFDDKPEPESPCATLGQCKPENGRCIAGDDADCKAATICKDKAQCKASDGRCSASEEDCRASATCTKDGNCGVVNGACAATSSKDCRAALRCELEGTCTAKDGVCIAASSADCARSSNCKTVNRCTAENGACVSSGRRSAESSEPPDKVGSTTLKGLFEN